MSADVISINAGGTGEFIVNPDQFIEGFFSGIPSAAPVCGNGVIESGEQCDDGNTINGDGCSSTCQIETVTPPSGGGVGGEVAPTNINVNPTQLNINLVVNTTVERTIQVQNLGTSQVTISVSHNLGSHAIIENPTLIIDPGQTVNLKVIFVALSEPGIFTGTINIGGKTVFVSLNVKTKFLLFDSNIIVLNKDYKVPQGDELKTRVTLIPLGDHERLDVSLLFTIRDYSGKIYLTKSETMLVDRLTELNRNFDTGSLPLGRYVVGLELRYPNGVAPSSAHFEVISSKKIGILVKIILFLISLIILILIIIILILIWKRLKKREEEPSISQMEQ